MSRGIWRTLLNLSLQWNCHARATLDIFLLVGRSASTPPNVYIRCVSLYSNEKSRRNVTSVLPYVPNVIDKAHSAVPGGSICSMRVPCAGDQRRARGDIGWLR